MYGADLACLHIVEALDEADDGGLATARLPHQGQAAPRGHCEAEVAEHLHLGTGGVPETHPPQLHTATCSAWNHTCMASSIEKCHMFPVWWGRCKQTGREAIGWTKAMEQAGLAKKVGAVCFQARHQLCNAHSSSTLTACSLHKEACTNRMIAVVEQMSSVAGFMLSGKQCIGKSCNT